MRKAKSLLGLNIVSQLEGKQLGTVRDLIFDESSHRLLALLLTDRELFGAIDATVIPWMQVREIGPHAVLVPSEEVILKAHTEPMIAESFDQKKKLDGKKITTQGGEDLGTVSDLYLDDAGHIQGFEVSGGMFADAFSGKRYMPLPTDIVVGEDVILVPREIAHELQRQKEQEPGGLAATAGGIGAKAGDLLDTAKTKVTETYENIATASVEKQRAFVIGKTASRDVSLPSDQPTMAVPQGTAALAQGGGAITTPGGITVDPMQVPTPATSTDISSSGEIVRSEILVRQGETITEQHADRAIQAGILGQLVTAAAGGTVTGALSQGQEAAGEHGAAAQERAETAALGQPSAREITAPDGSVIVAPGMIITRAILDRADQYGKKNEVIAAAGMGAASVKAQDALGSAKETAGGLWETIKEKTAELTGTAQEKKAEYDEKAEQNKINNALGRPTTRVILAKDDSVILNTGDIITHKAVELARQQEVLPVLLDSVYTADPEITPEMLRATEPGEAALETQAQPTGAPITATVMPDQPAQTQPSQGDPSQAMPR